MICDLPDMPDTHTSTTRPLLVFVQPAYYSGMTKYRIDRIITGVYTGPLAKRHCTALWHALTLMWTVITLQNALEWTRSDRTTSYYSWIDVPNLDRTSSCVAATAPMLTKIRRKQTMNN